MTCPNFRRIERTKIKGVTKAYVVCGRGDNQHAPVCGSITHINNYVKHFCQNENNDHQGCMHTPKNKCPKFNGLVTDGNQAAIKCGKDTAPDVPLPSEEAEMVVHHFCRNKNTDHSKKCLYYHK